MKKKTFKIKIKKKPQQIFKLPKEHSNLLHTVKSRIAVFFSPKMKKPMFEKLTLSNTSSPFYTCLELHAFFIIIR